MSERIAIVTGGGDCPGLNTVIRAVVKAASRRGWESIGFLGGYDGMLSPAEFAALANSDAVPTNPQAIMGQFDTDRDGVVTLVEYRIATQSNFDRIDSNRDGVVTSDEMRAGGLLQ